MSSDEPQLVTEERRRLAPLHRSVRWLAFSRLRLLAWIVGAAAWSGTLVFFHDAFFELYRRGVEALLSAAGVPFQPEALAKLGPWSVPAWYVPTFNPVASGAGLLVYGGIALLVILVAICVQRVPLPLAAWLSMGGGIFLLSVAVLHWIPVPRLTPAEFSGLWGQVTLGTAFLYPWVWALLVGVLPVSSRRALGWGVFGTFVMLAWNMVRLALFLAIAWTGGVVWLPVAFILGCTLPDLLVLVSAFSRVMDASGPQWASLS